MPRASRSPSERLPTRPIEELDLPPCRDLVIPPVTGGKACDPCSRPRLDRLDGLSLGACASSITHHGSINALCTSMQRLNLVADPSRTEGHSARFGISGSHNRVDRGHGSHPSLTSENDTATPRHRRQGRGTEVRSGTAKLARQLVGQSRRAVSPCCCRRPDVADGGLRRAPCAMVRCGGHPFE